MQGLTAAPRDGLTEAQVRAVLNAPAVTVSVGLDQLDENDMWVADLQSVLASSGSSVTHDSTALVCGTCTLNISQELNWGSVRVRPWMALTANGVTARWNLGVYVLTTPVRNVGQSVETYQVTGYDKNYLLQNLIGDSYTVTAGTNVLTAVQDVIAASGVYGAVLLDTTAASATVPADMVWPFSSSEQDSYLTVANALLATISYYPLWVDQDGNFRSSPAANPSTLPVEWAFTADDAQSSLIGVARALTNDLWDAPNEWIFTNTSMPNVANTDGTSSPKTPTSGDGIYTYDNVNTGPSSQNALGFIRRAAYFIDAADQPSLEAAAQIQIAADMNVIWSVDTTKAVFPGSGHYDVYTLQDSKLGGLFKVQEQKWVLPLDPGSGSTGAFDMPVTWVGAS